MTPRMIARAFAPLAPFVLALAPLGSGCGGGAAPDARYPSREVGCPVKSYPADPPQAVDDLGVVAIDCTAARMTVR